jgi:hypothetical protein
MSQFNTYTPLQDKESKNVAIDEQRTVETIPDSSKTSRSFHFSLRELLLIVALVAIGFAYFVQQNRLTNVRAALSRYEATEVPTSMPTGQFRIISQKILDTDNVKVMKYRIESADPYFATLGSGRGDSYGRSASQDAKTGLYFTEATVLIDHIKSEKCVKLVASGGYSITPVADDYKLNQTTTFHDVNGVFPRTESVELFKWNGKSYSLDLK